MPPPPRTLDKELAAKKAFRDAHRGLPEMTEQAQAWVASIVGPLGDGEGVFLGTMVDFANHCVDNVRPTLQTDEDILHFMDGAKCHEDDIAGEIMRKDRQSV